MQTATHTKPIITPKEALIKVSAALVGFSSSSDHSGEALSTPIKSLAKKKGKEVLEPLKCHCMDDDRPLSTFIKFPKQKDKEVIDTLKGYTPAISKSSSRLFKVEKKSKSARLSDFSLLAALSDPSFDLTVLNDLDDDLEGQLMFAAPQLPLGVA